MTVAPTTVTGGSGATGTVRFSRATDGALVQLSSNNPAVSVPSETFVGGGASTGAFAITTTAVTAQTVATITARWFGVTKTTRRRRAPAPADTVRIARRWQRGRLTIEATSTDPTRRSSPRSAAVARNRLQRIDRATGWHRNVTTVGPAVGERSRSRLRERFAAHADAATA